MRHLGLGAQGEQGRGLMEGAVGAEEVGGDAASVAQEAARQGLAVRDQLRVVEARVESVRHLDPQLGQLEGAARVDEAGLAALLRERLREAEELVPGGRAHDLAAQRRRPPVELRDQHGSERHLAVDQEAAAQRAGEHLCERVAALVASSSSASSR